MKHWDWRYNRDTAKTIGLVVFYRALVMMRNIREKPRVVDQYLEYKTRSQTREVIERGSCIGLSLLPTMILIDRTTCIH
jgi:hypothetical protein